MASDIEKIRELRKLLRAESGRAEASDTEKIHDENSGKHGRISSGEERLFFFSGEVRFYGIADLVDMLGWSRHTVLKLFGDPEFPAVDFGKRKVVESHALIEYFSRRRSRSEKPYWSGNA